MTVARCAPQATCDDYSRSEDKDRCSQVEFKILPAGNTCHFCCVGDNCNTPPQVIPQVSTLYPQH